MTNELNLPEGWEIKKLGELYNITSSKRVYKSEWRRSGVPFYRAREIVKLAQQGFVENELFITEEMYDQYSVKYDIPKEGDIMVTGVGTLGICYVVQNSDKFYFKDGNIIWLKKKNGINSQFVEYAFKSDFLRKQIDNTLGATVGTYTIIKAKNTLIPTPSLPEQKRIVAILDEAFENIARAKESAEKNLKNANEIFESYLQSVFENKGEGWGERNIQDVVDSRCTLSYGIVQPGNDFPNGSPVIRPIDLKNKFVHLTGLKLIDPKLADSYKRTILRGGELLLCVRGNTGIISIASEELKGANVTRGIVPICFDFKILSLKFGYYQFISNFINRQIKEKTYGTALMQINIRDLRKLSMLIPSISEQQSIVTKLDALSAETKKLEAIYTQKLADLEELKKSILQKAFNGELTEASA